MDPQAPVVAAKVATVEVSLPPAPVQPIELAKRVVTISGSASDGSQDVAIGVTSPITLTAALDAKVSVTVAEVLVNGRQSPPCTVSFSPYDQVLAIAADPAGYAVRVVAVG
jgi:hypothetical protein